jgi:hypothetical protein
MRLVVQIGTAKILAEFMKAMKKHDTTPLRTNGCGVSNM